MQTYKKSLLLLKDLLFLVRPLAFPMMGAVFFGALGHILATAIPSLGSYWLLTGEFNVKTGLITFGILALCRSLFRYFEQLLNHFVAFRTLAIIRDKVFRKLRDLAPAKMEEKNKGELISVISADIELMEVFYAHTISPVIIAIIHTLVLTIFMVKIHWAIGLCLLVSHLILGVAVPIYTEKKSRDLGPIQRKILSDLNLNILESFKGIKELVNFNYGDKRSQEVTEQTKKLNQATKNLTRDSGKSFGLSRLLVFALSGFFGVFAAKLYQDGQIPFNLFIFSWVIFLSSFGPTSALASLANNLVVTLACARRVLGLLKEDPKVDEVLGGKTFDYENFKVEKVTFSHDKTPLLDQFSMEGGKNQIIGLAGKSGCGKSSLIHLMMRFYDPEKGKINYNGINLKEINSSNLRKNIGYLSQSTHLFKGSIRDNLLIAKKGATEEELIYACKKAAIYDFIKDLPQGLDTEIVRDQNLLSSGEMQRLSMARLFLKNPKLYLLDEPTANVDAMTEGIILKSIYQDRQDKTILITSHRESTLRICQAVIYMQRQIRS